MGAGGVKVIRGMKVIRGQLVLEEGQDKGNEQEQLQVGTAGSSKPVTEGQGTSVGGYEGSLAP